MVLLNTSFAAISETAVQATSTPIWVPLLIFVLILLLLWWGLTRGRVYDENFPRDAATTNVDEHVSTHGAHHD
jgi:nitrogen fixation-related uncharacterized protein